MHMPAQSTALQLPFAFCVRFEQVKDYQSLSFKLQPVVSFDDRNVWKINGTFG